MDPARQLVHKLPRLAANFPAGHNAQTEDPARELKPASQRMHSARPVPCWNEPAGQGVHCREPACLAIDPTGQAVQELAPEALKKPVGHVRQVAEPGGAYLPAAHATHEPVVREGA